MNKAKFRREISKESNKSILNRIQVHTESSKELEQTMFELHEAGRQISKTLIDEQNDLITKIEICQEELKRREIIKEIEDEKTM